MPEEHVINGETGTRGLTMAEDKQREGLALNLAAKLFGRDGEAVTLRRPDIVKYFSIVNGLHGVQT